MTQFDFFSTPGAAPPIEPPGLTLLEHASPSYAPRTTENARKAALTVAFAVDFTTAGEQLTKRAARNQYIAFELADKDYTQVATHICMALGACQHPSLNIAGNGIYTLLGHGFSQAQVNQHVYEVLKRVHARTNLSGVRSGGQTGVDVAGLVAGIALGLPTLGLFPQGFRQRTAAGQDICRKKEELQTELYAQAESLSKQG